MRKKSRKGARQAQSRQHVPLDGAAINKEVDYIVRRAKEHDARIVSLGPLVFFSTEIRGCE